VRPSANTPRRDRAAAPPPNTARSATDLSRLLRPRSVAVVGASERSTSYGGEALRNLARLRYEGRVYAVNPKYSTVRGVPCFPSLDALPEAVDAVVVAIPAAAAPAVVEQAGARGCGGAVVFAAGFGEAPGGAALERELADAARRWSLPVCGPNGNGIVSMHERCALWGDAVAPAEPGPVALISASGNVAVNALGARRGLRLHTVVSCGNGAVLDAADFVAAVCGLEGVRSIALYLEDDGDGARWCSALEACARAGVGVAVLKAGSSPAGAAAAQAHTHALAGDQRVVRALFEEAGAAWARDPHELLELAKALAADRSRHPLGAARSAGAEGGGHAPAASGRGRFARAARSAPGLAVMTCSGGDSAVAADLAAELGVDLPALQAATVARLRETLPEAATAANPLDYTALLWYDQPALRALILALADDPAIDRILVLFDYAMGVGGDVDESWAGIVDAVRAAAASSPVPVALASTLPELLDDEVAARMIEDGMPALAGLAPALRCMQALAAPPPDPERLAEIGRAAREGPAPEADGWLAEHEAKALLRTAGLPVVDGRLAADAEDAVAAWGELGGPVALKLSARGLRHKSENGAVLLGLASSDAVRAAADAVAARAMGPDNAAPDAVTAVAAALLVERMAPPGVELVVAARRGLVPVLVFGLGGIWTEALDDVALVPLPATPQRIERALLSLRGAPLLTGARGRPAVDVAAAARLAASAGDLLLEAGLDLLELNPVIVHEQGAIAVDALARTQRTPVTEDVT
jgi:acetate---CoA ligase (ADP-forming)